MSVNVRAILPERFRPSPCWIILARLRMARCPRAETTMTLRWIAQRLQMGVCTPGSKLLHRTKSGWVEWVELAA